MRLATLAEGGRDGALAVVDASAGRVALPPQGPPSLRVALEDWPQWEPRLRAVEEQLAADRIPSRSIADVRFAAPLPRTFLWCEGSTYLPHMERIRGMRGVALPSDHGWKPAVYQAGGAEMLAPTQDIPLPDVSWDLDVEGTIGVITDDVPVGTTAQDAPRHVKLLVLLNDLTYRALIPEEYERRVGIFRSKPARPFAPFAITPDSLGDRWDGRLLSAQVRTRINGREIGRPDSGVDCGFDFARLIEQMTLTRSMPAGSIVGSGTVSNRAPEAGLPCIAEMRAVEIAERGTAKTSYLVPGDEVAIEAFAGEESLFGAMKQKVVAA